MAAVVAIVRVDSSSRGPEPETAATASEPEQAATLLTFALGHERLPPSYSVAARPALEALEAELPPEQLAAARYAAAATSLDDFVDQALAVTAPN